MEERVILRPERAVWWPARALLLIADLHLGKPQAFAAAGVPVPHITAAHDLDRLARLIDDVRAQRLIILGDIVHARAGLTTEVESLLCDWIAQRRALDLRAVLGNHDKHSAARLRDMGLPVEQAPIVEPPFVLRHEPTADDRGYVLAGHLHPAALLGAGPGALRAPCFWFGPSCGVLPAFGSFTGSKKINPAPGDRVFAVGPDRVLEVSRCYGSPTAEPARSTIT